MSLQIASDTKYHKLCIHSRALGTMRVHGCDTINIGKFQIVRQKLEGHLCIYTIRTNPRP